ncbi:MAG: glycosyltransferase family 9 protein [Patescibacteria group bacterium]|jgi:ADP-heptose:LPS heptosyltransferase
MNYSYTNSIVRTAAYVVDAFGNLFFWFSDNKIDNTKIKKIIFVKLDNIGDCFLSTPIFYELKKINENVVIDVLCLEASKEIFVSNNSVSSVITIKNKDIGEIFGVLKMIKEGGYDVFIDARGYAKVSLLGLLSGVKIRMGFMEEVFNCFYTHKMSHNKTEHESKKYLEILNRFGLGGVSSWVPFIDANSPEEILKTFSKKIIAIHPGASLDYKRWPVEKWIKLIRLILELNNDFEIAVLGSKDEMKIGEKITSEIKNNRIKDLVGKMSIADTYVFLSRCFLFLGSDSALGHLAGSQEIPTIVLMNAVIDKNRWSPLGSKVRVIIGHDKDHNCLYDKCTYPCANMDSITVDEIFNEVSEIIKAND